MNRLTDVRLIAAVLFLLGLVLGTTAFVSAEGDADHGEIEIRVPPQTAGGRSTQAAPSARPREEGS